MGNKLLIGGNKMTAQALMARIIDDKPELSAYRFVTKGTSYGVHLLRQRDELLFVRPESPGLLNVKIAVVYRRPTL